MNVYVEGESRGKKRSAVLICGPTGCSFDTGRVSKNEGDASNTVRRDWYRDRKNNNPEEEEHNRNRKDRTKEGRDKSGTRVQDGGGPRG